MQPIQIRMDREDFYEIATGAMAGYKLGKLVREGEHWGFQVNLRVLFQSRNLEAIDAFAMSIAYRAYADEIN